MRRNAKSLPTLTNIIQKAALRISGEHKDDDRRYAGIKGIRQSSDPLASSMTRSAQSMFPTSGMSNITAPSFYTPFTTPSSFQIPNTRKEIYLWAQWFYDNEPKIAAAISFYTDFPFSGFELQCSNGLIKKWYEDLVNKLNFPKWLPLIAFHYYLFGDCFTMLNIDCKKCKGLNKLRNGEACKHEGATWKSVSILNAEHVEVSNYLNDQDPMYFISNYTDELVKVVQEQKPKEVYDQIPEEIRKKILNKEPMKLDNTTVYHFKHGASANQPYGTSIVRRCFQTLAYKDKLRQAQWLIAERHILPIKIVQIGSEERPASEDDLQQAQDELTNVANDPLLTLVTHHNFKLEWFGACLDKQTQVLTKQGFKEYYDVTEEDLIACYNSDTKQLEYHPYQEKYEYDYDSNIYGDMIHFNGKRYDIMVTPNHMMWVNSDDKWQKMKSQDIEDGDKFLSTLDWKGELPNILPYDEQLMLRESSLNDYLQLAGYYISEGSQKFEKRWNKSTAIQIYQNCNTKTSQNIENVMRRCFGDKLKIQVDNHGKNPCNQFAINNTKLAQYFIDEFGHRAENKKIPNWMLNLPINYLQILLDTLVEGDGNIRFSSSGLRRYKYVTTSSMLADNIQEILIKIGYNPKISIEKIDKENYHDIYRIYWTESNPETHTVKSRNISYESYKDKVWCFTVPTGIFITRRNGKIGIHGNSGKVLQLTNEFELINEELLDGMMLNKTLLNGEGPCVDSETETLTKQGWKYYPDITEDDEIATYNPDTKSLEWHLPTARMKFDHDGEMIHFKNSRIDHLVTPNHRCWIGKYYGAWSNKIIKWETKEAQDINEDCRFATTFNWDTTKQYPKYIKFGKNELHIDDYLELVGYHISEGSVEYNRYKGTKTPSGISITQTVGDNANKIELLMKKLPVNIVRDGKHSSSTRIISGMKKPPKTLKYALRWRFYNTIIAKEFLEEFGNGTYNKKIPTWIKNLPKDKLKILLDSLMLGDGCSYKTTNEYYTTSKQLADDVQEICLKLGYCCQIKTRQRKNRKLMYRVIFYKNTITSKKPRGINPIVYKNQIQKINYNGYVYCFEVPNHLYIVRRNGKVVITGNSYSNAQIGLLSIARRLERLREEVAYWIEEKVFKPLAVWNGFTIPGREGKDEYIYPKIKWADLELRDQTNRLNMIMSAVQNNLLSAQTAIQALGFDYDEEVERMRFEQAANFVNMPGGAAGGMGGGFSGGMGGGFSAGGIGGMPPGGGAPMGPEELGLGGGAPPPGGAPMPGGEAGGIPEGMPPAAAGIERKDLYRFAVSVVNEMHDEFFEPYQKRIATASKKVKSEIQAAFLDSIKPVTGRGFIGKMDIDNFDFPYQEILHPANGGPQCMPMNEYARWEYTGLYGNVVPQSHSNMERTSQKKKEIPPRVLFSGLEQRLYKIILSTSIPYAFYAQFLGGPSNEYQLDGAFPEIRLAIEADSETFHNNPNQIQKDRHRDNVLASQGWTVLRFTDSEIEEHANEVLNVILRTIRKLAAPPAGTTQTKDEL